MTERQSDTEIPIDVSRMPEPIRQLYREGHFTVERAAMIADGQDWRKIEFCQWLINHGSLTDYPKKLVRRYARRRYLQL